MDEFPGFPQETLQFYQALEKNNNRDWFEANKQDYVDYIQAPAQAFVEAMGARLKSISPGIQANPNMARGSIMRIYRDVRFSKDKTPYKTNMGIVFWEGEGKKTDNPGFYFHLNKDGALLYGGNHMFTRPFMAAYQKAVDDEVQAAQLEKLLADLEKLGKYEIGGEQYKRVPKGYDPDHKRAELLKYKGLYVKTPEIPVTIVTSPELVTVCSGYCEDMADLHKWMVAVNQTA